MFGSILLAAAVIASSPDSLSIRDLLDVATAQIQDLSPDGHWLAVTYGTRRDALGTDFSRDGDPTYVHTALVRLLVIDTKTGTQRAVYAAKKGIRAASWAPDNNRLAMLVTEGETIQVVVWNRSTGAITTAKIPAGQSVAGNSDLRWSDDGKSLVFATHSDAWRTKVKARFKELTEGPVTVLNASDDFLEWEQMTRYANERAIVAWDVAANTVKTLAPEAMIGSWTLARDNSGVTVQEDIARKTDYEQGGREYKLVTISNGTSRTLLPSLRNVQLSWNDDGVHYAYSQNGRVYVASITDSARRQILGPTGDDSSNGGRGARGAGRGGRGAGGGAASDPNRYTLARWSPTGDALAVTNRDGLWLVNIASGEKELVMTAPDSNATPALGGGGGRGGRGQIQAWSHDGRWMYFMDNSRTKWEHAIIRYDRQTKAKTDLVRDGRHYANLRLADSGGTAVLTIAPGNHVPDVYVTDGSLANPRQVLEVNPQLASKPIARTELISYLDADGQNRYGVLRYPANYQPGTRYPTVFIIYEDFFEDNWDAAANLLAAHGYAVVEPSVGFEIGYPGEAWLKGVTAAANKVIDMGVADSARLGVHGTSYGGYAVNLLVTQTHRFKAAINMSGKVDLISFYTDSPRLGARNITAAERNQDRIGATLWAQPQKYEQHSAILFADRITTPLLLLTGGQDHNVPALNEREMYYALRRLGKTVVWANYTNSGHGTPQTTESDFVDYNQRVLDWYAKYLGPSAPSGATSTGNQR